MRSSGSQQDLLRRPLSCPPRVTSQATTRARSSLAVVIEELQIFEQSVGSLASDTDQQVMRDRLLEAERAIHHISSMLDKITHREVLPEVKDVRKRVQALRSKVEQYRSEYPDLSPFKIDNGR